ETVLNNGVAIAISQMVAPNCNGVNTGQITIAASGGTPSYTYLWSNGNTTISIANVTAQSYSVTVADALSCSATATYALNAIDWYFYTYLTSNAANCGNNG